MDRFWKAEWWIFRVLWPTLPSWYSNTRRRYLKSRISGWSTRSNSLVLVLYDRFGKVWTLWNPCSSGSNLKKIDLHHPTYDGRIMRRIKLLLFSSEPVWQTWLFVRATLSIPPVVMGAPRDRASFWNAVLLRSDWKVSRRCHSFVQPRSQVWLVRDEICNWMT